MAFAVYCRWCEKQVAAESHGSFESGFGDARVNNRYLILECTEGGHPFLVWERYQEVSDSYGNCAYGWGSDKVLYPAEPDAVDPCVPDNIAKSYLEARRSFVHGMYTASAILCRRTIEGICADQGAPKKLDLKSKLSKLKANGIIDERIHVWADYVLRNLGNDAAHDVNVEITKEDASDALEFARAIIEYLYVFQTAFDDFKARREAAKNPAPPDEEQPS